MADIDLPAGSGTHMMMAGPTAAVVAPAAAGAAMVAYTVDCPGSTETGAAVVSLPEREIAEGVQPVGTAVAGPDCEAAVVGGTQDRSAAAGYAADRSAAGTQHRFAAAAVVGDAAVGDGMVRQCGVAAAAIHSRCCVREPVAGRARGVVALREGRRLLHQIQERSGHSAAAVAASLQTQPRGHVEQAASYAGQTVHLAPQPCDRESWCVAA
mmetsp:Transcript_21115/g.49429  ORF Transcript_21115/g.49429 Transcript_21115/m.49429 type:complete len:211 (-) Transcript_21115:929-1561(-)